MTRFDPSALDPGIRDVVVRLRAAGFQTTDSGDGVSKPPAPENLPFPHVFVQTSPYMLIAESCRLLLFLQEGPPIGIGAPPGFQVQGTFDPADRSAIIMVSWPERT
jgi:hypothetical protein